MAALFDIYLTGKLAQGVDTDTASVRLGQLFKVPPATMAGLLTGQPQVLKRGVDEAPAQKYREALSRAGVEVIAKPQAHAAAAAPTPAPTPPSTPKPGPSLAERLAAQSARPVAAAPAPVAAPVPAPSETGAFSLAPVGSDVLRPAERKPAVSVTIDTSELSVAPPGPLPAPPPVSAVVPSLDHLSLAAAGADLLSDSERERPPVAAPDTSDLSLAPVGSQIDTLQAPPPPPAPDTSAINLAPVGSDLLEAGNRPAPPPPPSTAHLHLVDAVGDAR